jgi:hypothetical protein
MDRFTDRPRRRPVLLLLAALSLGGAAGCPPAYRVPLYPVRGQVLYKGKPVERAMVTLHPLTGFPDGVPKPIAYTDADGRFRVTTDRPGDGAPAGEYAVTVALREKTRTGVEKVKGRNLLPARYSNPKSCGLRCRVQEGENDVPPLTLNDP